MMAILPLFPLLFAPGRSHSRDKHDKDALIRRTLSIPSIQATQENGNYSRGGDHVGREGFVALVLLAYLHNSLLFI